MDAAFFYDQHLTFPVDPTFETSAPNLQWLMRSLCIGVGERYPSEVVVRFWRVL